MNYKELICKPLLDTFGNPKEITCPQCDGTGFVDELDTKKVNSQTISPPYHKVKCEACEDGKIIKEN